MTGRIVAYNSKKGMAAVETSTGYTVFEILGGYEIELGNVVEGNLDTHAGMALLNLTRQESLEVFIEGIHCTEKNMREMMK